MADQILRDKNGKTIGHIRQVGNKLDVRNAAGTLKGTYDPAANVTRNLSGSIVGSGNQLVTLLDDR
jgi:hypothetical protein